MINNITQDLLVSFRNFGELVILFTKLFIDYNRFIINSVILCPDKEDMNEETEESKNKQHELKRRLEIANKLIRSLEELQELLRHNLLLKHYRRIKNFFALSISWIQLRNFDKNSMGVLEIGQSSYTNQILMIFLISLNAK
ncbi:hypothetical protein TSAR_015807 [Trichomalopsis sarcophagae]|uniref:Uncharacterized protein n=1 Tax=Trichomalopsis sarcophagae TaxID=543379 RepID=A0A232F056_9HYME|nr:hypothetical protein TSAR_015807 [Trichomalopsis sarcophagae]